MESNQNGRQPENGNTTKRKCKGNKIMKKNKSTRGRLVLNIFLILLGVLCILAAAAYLVIGYHFKTRFFPNTVINGMDCSDLEPDTVAALIKEQSMEYQVKLIGRDDKELGTLTAKEVGLNIDVTEEVPGDCRKRRIGWNGSWL